MPDRPDETDSAAPDDGAERPDRLLCHFAAFRLDTRFQGLRRRERAERLGELVDGLRAAADRVELYQLHPGRTDADLLMWSSQPAGDTAAPGRFFDGFTRTLATHDCPFELVHSFWGLTRPSPYTGRGGSDREIDAVGGERAPYLIVYPFSKSAEWYLLPEEERRQMMAEHIRIGRSFGDVRQLLLYSFGLQEQEFVVIYETADLGAFSDLVYALRATEARRFTTRDTPLLVGVHRAEEPATLPFV